MILKYLKAKLKTKMEKYYFKTTGVSQDVCLEDCQIKKPIRIGSVACQECELCVKFDKSELGNTDWIICEKIKEAIL